ncbi:peptidase domain-containing ABC transporter [Agaribacterium sp. ZY112]|uniref:peptidase domain-containing ABC transporter n=1 Tax=Agaribacterium sp. ZY112 TaxID=3233574 RepID=UPI0035267391
MSALNFSSRKNAKLVLQTEAAECGLACLAMVLSYHGHEIGLHEIRKEHAISIKGATLSQLMAVAEDLKLDTRPLRIDMEALEAIKLPAILHWDLNHFVVITKASKNSITILDPALGERKYSPDYVSKHFTGVALELVPLPSFEKKIEKERINLWDFAKSIHGLKSSLIQVLILSLVLQTIGIAMPYYMQLVVDSAVVNNDKNLVHTLGIGFLLLSFFSVGISQVRSWALLYMGTSFNYQLTSGLFRHLVKLPFSWFESRHVGDVVSRFGSVGSLQRAVSDSLIGAVLDGIMVVTTLIMMFLYSPKLAAIAVFSVFVYLAYRMIFFYPMRAVTEKQIVASAKENSHFIETLRAIMPLKMYNRLEVRISMWQRKFSDSMNEYIRGEKLRIAYSMVDGITSSIESIAIVWIGALLVIENEFSIGMLYAFVAWRGQFSGTIRSLINVYFEFKMLGLHMDRIGDIALTEQETASRTTYLEDKKTTKGALSISNLSFQYSESEAPVFSEVNLKVKHGESISIIAPSGFGKSTLLKVWAGLLKPTEGNIFVDEQDIEKIGLASYRSICASVMQDDVLLSGSVEENVSFFDEKIDVEKVTRCLQLAHVFDEIADMPMGLKTLVGDMGNAFSGGQTQRILLARALYQDPKILFLDEATSHLDTATETLINQALNQLAITRVVIAHRPETILMSDRIYDFSLREDITKADYKLKHTS